MRIKSPFKDYYDGFLRNDQEAEPLLLRKTSELEQDHLPLYSHLPFDTTRNMSFHVIGFAGNLYPYYAVDRKLIFDPEHLSSEYYRKGFVISDKVRDDLFEKFGPIFKLSRFRPYGRWQIELMPRLGEWFGKILPPDQAYQNLRSYLSNIALAAKPVPVMSNDIKIHQAGFDIRSSFRAEPGTSGPKRKRRS